MKNIFFPPFYSGQKVIYVGDPCEQLKKNKIYIVNGCKRNECGCWCVDVSNVVHELFDSITTRCTVCCSIRHSTYGYSTEIENGEVSGVWWFPERDFRPAEEMKAPAMTFEKIVQEEKKEVLIMN